MPPDLEPASALAGRIVTKVYAGPLHAAENVTALIEADRAAVREPLERRNRELETLVWDEREVILQQRERTASLEAQLEKTAVDAAETIADLKHTIGMHEERLDREQKRIASLEAQLASAREEALREAANAINELEAGHASTALNIGEESGLTRAEQAVRALLTSPPKSPWIPVEERLPFQGSPVLTLEAGGTMPMVCVYHDGTWYNIDNGSAYDVTHWMPIPELPPPDAQKEPPHG
jgi:hypothetical protein